MKAAVLALVVLAPVSAAAATAEDAYALYARGDYAEAIHAGETSNAAAGLATLEVYRTEGLFERAASLESFWEDAVHSLRGAPNVIDLRNIGIVGAIELEPRPGAPGARGFETFLKCFEAGVLVRSTADTIALSPPLIVERDQISHMFEVVGNVLRNVA